MRIPGRALSIAAALALLWSASAPAQSSLTGPVDPLAFSQQKDFQAFRSSSNNPDWSSNDDSKHPIAGETITIADLNGPGIVTHLWLTIAAREMKFIGIDGLPGLDGGRQMVAEGKLPRRSCTRREAGRPSRSLPRFWPERKSLTRSCSRPPGSLRKTPARRPRREGTRPRRSHPIN